MFRYKRVLLILGMVLLLGIAGYGALIIRNDQKARADLAGDLKIKDLPASVHNLSCNNEPVWTDVLWHCYFEIDPNDFSALLAGREYQVRIKKITSYDVLRRAAYDDCCNLGQNFAIAKEYFVQPGEFKNGGSITIYTDTTQRQVLYDLYIE